MSEEIRIISSRIVYENRWTKLREEQFRFADGTAGLYAWVEKSPSALIIPWDGEYLTLIEQFRYPLGVRNLEFPQGAVEGQDLAPEEIAREELRQETGLEAGKLSRLGEVQIAPGITSQVCTVFLAEHLSEGQTALEAEEKGLKIVRLSMDEFLISIQQGRLKDSVSLAAFALWKAKIDSMDE